MASVHLGLALGHIHRLFGEGTLAGLPDVQLLKRYVNHRDELAFEALVERHGPMVMSVCRGILVDPNDAEDAFQASFLLLARKAGSLRVSGALGGWLHRVSCRVALQLKSEAARRRDRERRAAELAGTGSVSSTAWDDRDTILHEEIDRLPERYRQPIVLCYLEEMTYQQAANHLHWSEGSTQGRLRRARDLLKARLTRRGVTLSGAGLSALTIPKTTSAVSTATAPGDRPGRSSFCPGRGRRRRSGLDGNHRLGQSGAPVHVDHQVEAGRCGRAQRGSVHLCGQRLVRHDGDRPEWITDCVSFGR